MSLSLEVVQEASALPGDDGEGASLDTLRSIPVFQEMQATIENKHAHLRRLQGFLDQSRNLLTDEETAAVLSRISQCESELQTAKDVLGAKLQLYDKHIVSLQTLLQDRQAFLDHHGAVLQAEPAIARLVVESHKDLQMQLQRMETALAE